MQFSLPAPWRCVFFFSINRSFKCGVLYIMLPYAFPSFILIPRVLSKVEGDKARLLLIPLVWLTQSWYPTLLSLLSELPVLFTQVDTFFRLNDIPYVDSFAWPLGVYQGNPWTTRNFQEGFLNHGTTKQCTQ